SRDNLSAGGIAVGLDIETGRLSDWGFFKPGFGKRIKTHPDTGFEFADFRLPLFQEACQMVCRLHEMFYGVHSIGWDVAITPSGPTILEGNNAWETPTLQVFDKELIKKYDQTLVNVEK
ncbi:MAG: sugar-transfer associated ATP-grasp domain-containing protein, partial [Planctomycetota bacterium]